MNEEPEAQAWIFVSHSSRDLPAVRRVRNYLEKKGAAPLLFHLRSLAEPEAFWPIIEAELKARNFFLYCESPAAETSEWVCKEREAVAKLAAERPIKIGKVRVDTDEIDKPTLNAFLRSQRVFSSASARDSDRVAAFLNALRMSGFIVYDAANTPIAPSESLDDRLERELYLAARDGWIVIFWSRAASASRWVLAEVLAASKMQHDTAVVVLDDAPVESMLGNARVIYDASDDDDSHPARFGRALLSVK